MNFARRILGTSLLATSLLATSTPRAATAQGAPPTSPGGPVIRPVDPSKVPPTGPGAPGAPGTPGAPGAPGTPPRGFDLQPAPHRVVPFERFTLPNGIRVVALQVPEAPKQALFTFLPLNLASEPAQQAQWSRLVERLLMRGTNANATGLEGVTARGDTRSKSMVLESSGKPALLARMAREQAGWLSTFATSEATLEREKAKLRDAQASASTDGTITSYAVAGWNQAIRHGRDEVLVAGDAQAASADAISTFLRNAVPIGPEILVATVGPVGIEYVKRFLSESYGGLAPRPATPAPQPTFRPTEPNKEVRVKWDMPTRHLIMWWPLTAEQMADRATLESAIAVMRTAIMLSQPQRGGGRPVPVIEGPLAPAVEGSAGTLLVDIPYGVGTAEPASIRTETETALALVTNPQFAATPWKPRLILPLLGNSPPPYRPEQRAALRERGDDLEPMWLLTTMTWEYEWGKTREEMAAAIDATTITGVQELTKQIFATPPRLLVLEQMNASAADSAPVAPGTPAPSGTPAAPAPPAAPPTPGQPAQR